MNTIKNDFEQWLITTKKYKYKSAKNKPSTISDYSYQLNKLCRFLYLSEQNLRVHAYECYWKQLGEDILPVMTLILAAYSRKKINPAKIKEIMLNAVKMIRSIRIIDRELEFLENDFPNLAKTSCARGKIKKAVFLYYKFLKRKNSKYKNENNENKYQEIDDRLVALQRLLSRKTKLSFILEPQTINNPICVQPEIEKGEDDWISCSESIKKLYHMSKSTLYRLAKKGKITSIKADYYSITELNDYIKANLHISPATQSSYVSCNDEFKELLTAEKAAQKLYPKNSRATGRRYLAHLRDSDQVSYLKLGTRKFLYFPNDIERLKREIKK